MSSPSPAPAAADPTVGLGLFRMRCSRIGVHPLELIIQVLGIRSGAARHEGAFGETDVPDPL